MGFFLKMHIGVLRRELSFQQTPIQINGIKQQKKSNKELAVNLMTIKYYPPNLISG